MQIKSTTSCLMLALMAFLFFSCKDKASMAPDKSADQDAGKATAQVRRKNIIYFGNSLTAAYNLSPEQGFVALIQKKIDSLGLAYTCVNARLVVRPLRTEKTG